MLQQEAEVEGAVVERGLELDRNVLVHKPRRFDSCLMEIIQNNWYGEPEERVWCANV